MVCFKSILQGDHLGVEIATQAHANLLMSTGLLRYESRMVSNRPLFSSREAQGLCIDDFFSLSVEDRFAEKESDACNAFDRARKLYDAVELEGSPHKDLINVSHGKIIGACLNSSDRALKLGVCTVGASPEKRYGLSMISLQIAQLSHTSDALHLCLLGGWSSTPVTDDP